MQPHQDVMRMHHCSENARRAAHALLRVASPLRGAALRILRLVLYVSSLMRICAILPALLNRAKEINAIQTR